MSSNGTEKSRRQRHSEVFVRLAWAEGMRRGGVLPSRAICTRLGLWFAAYFIDRDWLAPDEELVKTRN